MAVAFGLNRGLSAWLAGLGGNTKSVNQWMPNGQRGLLYGLSPTDPLNPAAEFAERVHRFA